MNDAIVIAGDFFSMRKQMFFLLSSVVVCVQIAGMDQAEQKRALVTLPKELIYKTTQYCDLQSIGRLKRVNKQLSQLDTVHMMCMLHGENEHNCSSVAIAELAKEGSYDRCMHALDYCILSKNEGLSEYLYNLHPSTFFSACEGGNVTIAKFLIAKKRANCCEMGPLTVKGRSISSVTPFFAASSQGHVEIVKLLIENNMARLSDSYYDSRHDKRRIAAFVCYNGQIEVVKLLQQHNLIDIYTPYCFGNGYRSGLEELCDVLSETEEGIIKLNNEIPFLDRNPRFLRNTTVSLLVGGIGYSLYTKFFNS